jgi:hypothetical protein
MAWYLEAHQHVQQAAHHAPTLPLLCCLNQLMVLLVAHGMQQLQTHHHITSQHSRKDSSTAAGVLLAPSGCACMCSQLAHIVNVKMGKFCYFPCLVHSFPLLLLLLVVLVCCCNASFALCSIHTAAVSEHCIDEVLQ